MLGTINTNDRNYHALINLLTANNIGNKILDLPQKRGKLSACSCTVHNCLMHVNSAPTTCMPT